MPEIAETFYKVSSKFIDKGNFEYFKAVCKNEIYSLHPYNVDSCESYRNTVLSQTCLSQFPEQYAE